MTFNYDLGTAQEQQNSAAINQGLRSYMLKVYNWMAFGLIITALMSYAVVNTSMRDAFFHVTATGVLAPTVLGWVGVVAPLGFMLVMSFGVNRLSLQAAQMLFMAFSACMGISTASLLFVYTGASVVQTFFITASAFAGLSIFGYVTRHSLSGMGSFLFMALFGMIIASLVSMFVHSAALNTAISFAGVLIFAGLTAFDTQRIKTTYTQYLSVMPADAVGKQSIFDALSMYLDFLNLFQFLLQFTGTNRSND